MERPDNKNVECLNKQDMTSCYVKLIRIDESDKKTPTQGLILTTFLRLFMKMRNMGHFSTLEFINYYISRMII